MATRIQQASYRKGGIGSGLLGGALIGVALTGGFWFLYGSRIAPDAVQEPQPIVAAFDMVEVPVPAAPVAPGTPVSEIGLRRLSYPRHQIPTGAVVDLRELEDLVSAVALPANMPLFAENFARKQSGLNSVVSRIPTGMRAMTIRVDATAAVEGWAGSGSVVDVLLIAHEKTSVIAEKVKILSAERVVEPVEGDSSPQVPSTVTLLVDQEQCLAINTAIPMGKIAFALRAPDDQASWVSAQYTAERLKGKGSIAADNTAGIKGFFTVPGEGGGKSFALSGDRWVETQVVPQGFRVMDSAAERHVQQGEAMHAAKQY